MRDPLAVLARLRRLQTDEARRVLAERMERTAAAHARHGAAVQALPRERAAAQAAPSDHAAWLVRGFAERDRADALVKAARDAEESARQELATARAAARAVEDLVAARGARAKRDAIRQDQSRLDETAAQRRPLDAPPGALS